MKYSPEKLKKFCAAPWAESVLNNDGTLNPCCNNEAVMGNWQKDGLENVWKSQKYQDFRKKIIEGKFPNDSCRRCYINLTAIPLNTELSLPFENYKNTLFQLLSKKIPEINSIKPLFSKIEVIDFSILQRYFTILEQIESTTLDKRIILVLNKLRVIGATLKDFLTSNLSPSITAPLRRIQLITKCNARCIHCTGNYLGTIINGDILEEKYIKEALANPKDVIYFFNNGSELLLYKRWKEIMQLLSSYEIKPTLSTNGILLTKSTIRFLVDSNSLQRLNISIDGAFKDTVEAIRVNVNFDKLIENIAYFFDYAAEKNSSFPLTISFVLMNNNYQELPELINLIHSLRGANKTTEVNIVVQALTSMGVKKYMDFVHAHHHTLIGKESLINTLRKTLDISNKTHINVGSFFGSIEKCIQEGCIFLPLANPTKLIRNGVVRDNAVLDIHLDAGWYDSEGEEYPSRWTKENASIIVTAKENIIKTFSLTIMSFHRPRTCAIKLNNLTLQQMDVNNNEKQIIILELDLTKGVNTIDILSQSEAEAPADIPELNSPDPRNLAFHVTTLEIS